MDAEARVVGREGHSRPCEPPRRRSRRSRPLLSFALGKDEKTETMQAHPDLDRQDAELCQVREESL